MNREMRTPYPKHTASGLPHFRLLVRFIQAQDQQSFHTQSEIVTECLLNRSMFIKLYLPEHVICMYIHMLFTVNFAQRLT